MKKSVGFFLIFCFCFVFSWSANAQTPIELRPKFSMKYCDTSNLSQNPFCLDWEYFIDEIELVIGDSIYAPLPDRIDKLWSVRQAIGEGVLDEYELYSERFARKQNLNVTDLASLKAAGLDKIVRIKFKNIYTQEKMGRWLAIFTQDYNIKSLHFSSMVKTVSHTTDPRADEQWYLEAEHFHEAHLDENVGFGSPEIHTTIFDSGYDATHEDLPPLAGWFDHVSGSAVPNDVLGHGTAVAGVLMQIPNNFKGGVGVSPGISLTVRKVLQDNGIGEWSVIAEAVVAQTKVCKGLREENPNVRCTFSFSLAGLGPIPSVDAALDFAFKEGIVAVAAAGNWPISLDNVPVYPATKKGVIAAAALDKNGKLAGWSAFGKKTFVVGAGGVAILVAFPKNERIPNPQSYKLWEGTSFATPQVVGAINLAWSKYRHLDTRRIKLLTLGSSDPIEGLKGLTTSGGRLNAFLMTNVPEGMPDAPVNLEIINATHSSITTSHRQTGDVLGYLHYISEDPFDEFELDDPDVKVMEVMNPTTDSTIVTTITDIKENTRYYVAVQTFNRGGNYSFLSPVVEGLTKKSQVFASRTFTDETGNPDPGQWFPDFGPLATDGHPVPWYLTDLLPSSKKEILFNWRFGRRNALDYYTGSSDAIVLSEIFDLRGLSGASMTFDYFQNLSVVDFGDTFQVFAVSVDEFNINRFAVLLKEYAARDGSKKLEMSEKFLDLTPIAGTKFRLIFRVVNRSTGLFGGMGWMFGNVKIYTDQRTYLY